MHIEEADLPLLKTWLIKRLEDICDADSDVLADYVLALISPDDPDDEIRSNCLENLEDFLREHTAKFVEDVLNAVHSGSYKPGYTAPRLNATSTAFVPAVPAHSNGSAKKRAYGDRDDSEPANGDNAQYGDRAQKQMRRGGRGGSQRGRGRGENFNAGHIGQRSQWQMPEMAPLQGLPQNFPSFDMNDPMAAMQAMAQVMGFPMQGFPTVPGQEQVKQRCRDYDTLGYCAAGVRCPYDHGADRIVIPGGPDEYDPTQSFLSTGSGRPSPSAKHGNGDARRGQDSRGRGSRGRAAHQGSRGRANFSAPGPMHDRRSTGVVVEQIPEDKFSEASVRSFFEEFGVIESVELQPARRLAILRYADHASAKRAYESPKVIFDNRFVKVYWHRPDTQQPMGGSTSSPVSLMTPQQARPHDDEEMIDPAEFVAKQAEAQRVHEEKAKKLAEADAAKAELTRRMQAQAEERRLLLEKLAKKTGQAATAPIAAVTLAPGSASSDPIIAKPTSQTEALRAKLAELEAQAASLGISTDTSSPQSQTHHPFASASSYPRGRARGGGGWRGGSYRGRGGSGYGYPPRGGGYDGGAVKRLDNRPRSIAVIATDPGVNFDLDEAKLDSLRQYVFTIDPSSTATTLAPRTDTAAAVGQQQQPQEQQQQATQHTSLNTRVVTFAERYVAEMFIAAAARSREIPGVGRVELSWVANAAAPMPTPSSAVREAEAQEDDGDAAMNDGAGDGAAVGAEATVVQREEVDWDVADDDDDRWMK